MNKESYNKLKEINSLDQEVMDLNQKIEQELLRIGKLEDMKNHRVLANNKNLIALKEFKKEIQNVENEIASSSTSLKKSELNLAGLIEEKDISALSSQVEMLKLKINEQENKGLELLELISEYEDKLAEFNEFKIGIEETIKELTEEIQDKNKDLLEKVQINKERIKLLTETLPDIFKDKFTKLLKKNLKYGPLTKIVNKDCYICKYQLNTNLVIQVEDQMKLTSCESCQRIFIPTSCSY